MKWFAGGLAIVLAVFVGPALAGGTALRSAPTPSGNVSFEVVAPPSSSTSSSAGASSSGEQSSSSSDTGGENANTGTPVRDLLMVGGVLIALGALVVVVTRRRGHRAGADAPAHR